MPGNFLGSFDIGFQRGFFDIALTGRFARIDVDGDQRFGRVDDDVAAGFKLNFRIVHRVELLFDLKALVKRNRAVAVLLHPFRVARHHQPHKALCGLVGFKSFDLDFLDVLAVDVADGAFDDVAFLIDHRRRARFQGLFTYFVPGAYKVFEIALDLGLVAFEPGGANNDAHALWHIERIEGVAEFATFLGDRDLARNAPAARRIWHQHAIAAGQRDIGGKRGAFIAALFLDHLNQKDLPPLDDFLDFIAAHRPGAARRRRLGGFQRFFDVGIRGDGNRVRLAVAGPRGFVVVSGFIILRRWVGVVIFLVVSG